MRHRIPGFDIARAYAIFGMFVVNFNFCFGALGDRSFLGQFLNLFIGNSTAIFIICAGMGVSLMTMRQSELTPAERKQAKSIIFKRSLFLFALGLLLYNWWPGDILHFYGGYLHLATLLLFVSNRYLLWLAVAAIVIFHVLLYIIPIQTSWDFQTYRYADFWTVKGFLRNTFYNGWNSIFPWGAYFLLGMWLGRLDWKNGTTQKAVFFTGLSVFQVVQVLRKFALMNPLEPQAMNYLMADYFPPYLPFMLITASFAVMVIATCIWLGDRFLSNKLLSWLSETGKMTLTHYVMHLTIGVLVYQALSGIKYTGLLQTEMPSSPLYVLCFSVLFFAISVAFSIWWSRRFEKGPLELVMRKFSG